MKRLMFIFLLFLLAGCYDKMEVEQQSYVIAIGLDKTDKEGNYRITFQAANPEVGSSVTSGGSQEAPRETVTLEGNDLIAAKDTANSVMTKQIALDHTKVVVVSEELARSGEFLRLIQAATRTTELRRAVQIIVSKENASEFLRNNQPIMETRPHKYYQYMLTRASQTGIIPQAEIHRFFQITEGDADAFLAIYATTVPSEKKDHGNEDEFLAGQIPLEGGNPTQFMGSAVFKEGKMIDTLTGQETRMANILDETMEMGSLYSTYPDPKRKQYRIATSFSKNQPTEVKIDYRKNQPTRINVTVPFSIEVIAVPSLVDYSKNEENRKLLEAYIPKVVEEEAEKLIKKTQEEYQTDAFYWSLYIRKHFKTIDEYEAANWNQKIYPNAEINIDFKLKQLYFGKMINDSNLGEVRD